MPTPHPRLSLQARLHDGPPAAPALQKVFDERGGTIGRAAQNDWVLPDPARFLSAHHATLYFEGGRYQLVDCSTNGIYFNDEPEPLGPGRTVALSQGDRLQFGDYEIEVSITSMAADPLQLLEAPTAAATVAEPARQEPWFDPRPLRDASASLAGSAVVDPLALLGHDAARPAPAPAPASQRDDVPLLASFFQPPVATAPVPDDWFNTGIAAAPIAAPASESLQAALDLLLQAAGLDPARTPRHADPKRTLQTAGGVLRESIAALRELMLHRAASRRHIGLAGTGISARDNNPLKFAARGAGEVIDSFLFDQGPACLDAKTAIREALQDLKAQRDEERAALLKGLHAQLDGLDPQRIEQACATPRRLRLGSAKAACWALYRERHAELRRQLGGGEHDTPTPLPRRHAAHPTLELNHGLE